MVTYISQIDYKGTITKTPDTIFKETSVSLMKLQKMLNEPVTKQPPQHHKTLPKNMKLHIKSNSLGFYGEDGTSKTLRIKLSEELKSPGNSSLTTPKSSRTSSKTTDHSPEKSPKKSPNDREPGLMRLESEIQLPQRKSGSSRRANFFKSSSVKIINSPKRGKINSANHSPCPQRKLKSGDKTDTEKALQISTDSISSEEDEFLQPPTVDSLSKSGPIARDSIIEPIRPVLYSLPEKPSSKSPKKKFKHKKKSTSNDTNHLVPEIILLGLNKSNEDDKSM